MMRPRQLSPHRTEEKKVLREGIRGRDEAEGEVTRVALVPAAKAVRVWHGGLLFMSWGVLELRGWCHFARSRQALVDGHELLPPLVWS